MPRKSPRKAAASPAAGPAKSLSEPQLRELLTGLRERAPTFSEPELPAVEAALAELESEAAARAITLPGDVVEPTPPALARHRFLNALVAGERETAGRALRWLDSNELWLAYRRIRYAPRDVRIYCWHRLLCRLDLLLLGGRAAAERQLRLQQLVLEAEELEAYLLQCIDSMFAVVFSGRADGEEDA